MKTSPLNEILFNTQMEISNRRLGRFHGNKKTYFNGSTTGDVSLGKHQVSLTKLCTVWGCFADKAFGSIEANDCRLLKVLAADAAIGLRNRRKGELLTNIFDVIKSSEAGFLPPKESVGIYVFGRYRKNLKMEPHLPVNISRKGSADPRRLVIWASFATAMLVPRVSAQNTMHRRMESRMQAPIALHQLVVVAPGGDSLVPLRGYDVNGDKMVATVQTLPAGDSGIIYQLSQVSVVVVIFVSD
jgi:hypothetical protein